jgi:hypothetical protein
LIFKNGGKNKTTDKYRFCLNSRASNPEMAIHNMYGRASIYGLVMHRIQHAIGNPEKMYGDA